MMDKRFVCLFFMLFLGAAACSNDTSSSLNKNSSGVKQVAFNKLTKAQCYEAKSKAVDISVMKKCIEQKVYDYNNDGFCYVLFHVISDEPQLEKSKLLIKNESVARNCGAKGLEIAVHTALRNEVRANASPNDKVLSNKYEQSLAIVKSFRERDHQAINQVVNKQLSYRGSTLLLEALDGYTSTYGFSNYDVARELLKFKNIDTTVTNANKKTTRGYKYFPLQAAAQIRTKSNIFETLLNHPTTDINQRDHNNRTALHSATNKCMISNIKELLDSTNIDPNVLSNENKSPLAIVLDQCYLNKSVGYGVDVLDLFAKYKKVDFNLKIGSGKGLTLFQYGLFTYYNYKEHTKLFEYLIKSPRVNMQVPDKNGKPTIDYITNYANARTVKVYLQNHKFDQDRKFDICQAINTSKAKAMLLARNFKLFDPNIKCNIGRSKIKKMIISQYVCDKDPSSFEFIVNHPEFDHSEVDEVEVLGGYSLYPFMAISYASKCDKNLKLKRMQYLISKDKNKSYKLSTVHHTIFDNLLELNKQDKLLAMDLFFKLPALNINQSTEGIVVTGDYFLNKAVKENDLEVINRLLTYPGINPRKSTQNGSNALEYALIHDLPVSVVKGIYQADNGIIHIMNRPSFGPMLRLSLNTPEVLSFLLSLDKLDINARRSKFDFGRTSLMEAASSISDEIPLESLELLLAQKSINVFMKDTHGYTALDLAEINGNEDKAAIIRKFIKKNR